MKDEIRIAILGAGNLGMAIADGLIKSGEVKATNITLSRRKTELLAEFQEAGVVVTASNLEAVKSAEVIIVALKPYIARDILKELGPHLRPEQLIISVVTGINLQELATFVPEGQRIFRAMPNTAVAIRESITCISHYAIAHSEDVSLVQRIFSAVGITIIIDEKLMDAATVLGACGIAYALRFIRAATQGGIEIGFDAPTASLIAAQTVKGAAELLLKLKRHPEEEIDKVTTPKGCTIAGLNEMEHQGFSSSLIKGICTSYEKIGK